MPSPQPRGATRSRGTTRPHPPVALRDRPPGQATRRRGRHPGGPLTLIVAGTIAAIAVSTQTGCMSLFANLAHAVGADKIPAEYEGLREQSVAVVTMTDASPYSEDRSARSLTEMVTEILDREVKEIEIVRAEKVDDWRDRNGWDETDFRAIGEGVEASRVVAIEITGLRMHEGPNLYRGHADVSVEVLNVESGETEYRKMLEDFTFPRNAAQDSGSISESKFRRIYLSVLSRQIARLFHPFDMNDDFALDSTLARF